MPMLNIKQQRQRTNNHWLTDTTVGKKSSNSSTVIIGGTSGSVQAKSVEYVMPLGNALLAMEPGFLLIQKVYAELVAEAVDAQRATAPEYLAISQNTFTIKVKPTKGQD